MMHWMLLVDTCGAEGSVAVADLHTTPRIVAERTVPGRETQERLMSAIAEVIAEASLTPADLHVLGVVTGPGSFTGVRIGLAAIKGLAEALQLPVVAVSRLGVLASVSETGGMVESWIDAGRGDVFAGRYEDGICLAENMLPGAVAVQQAIDPCIVMESKLLDLLPSARLVAPVGAREALPLLAAAVAAGASADVALMDANYLRVPDAELSRLAKLAAVPA